MTASGVEPAERPRHRPSRRASRWRRGRSPVGGHAVGAPAFRLGHRPSLDGLRGLAVLTIIVCHVGGVIAGPAFYPGRGGYLSLDVFFVLSGFLITTLLLEEWERTGAVSLRRFYARRALRLFPALALLLACEAIVATFSADPASRWAAIVAVLLYAANWVWALGGDEGVSLLGPLVHAWSLALEEQFYLLWPPILVGLLRRGTDHRRMLALVGLGILASTLLRAALWHQGTPFWRLYAGSDTRASSLLIGCAVALLATSDALPKSRVARRALTVGAGAAAVALVSLMAVAPHPGPSAGLLYYGGFTGVALAAAAVLVQPLVAPASRTARILGWCGLVWAGRLSYGLYLWHAYLLVHFANAIGPGPAAAAAGLGLTFVVAPLSYYLIEQPCLRLKARFQPVAAPGP